MKLQKHINQLVFIPLILSLTACDNTDVINENTGLNTRYDVTVTNITANQPLTPVAVVIHNQGYEPWALGNSASDGLEMLAESGSPVMFLDEASNHSNVIIHAEAPGLTLAGTSSTVSLQLLHSHDIYLSFASMLADTNDAFTGMQNIIIGELSIGESSTHYSHVFDAGTENNTETADTIPGPSSSLGEAAGFSSERETNNDFVSIHGGIVGEDELSGSALNESKRWLNYGAMIKITRVE